MAEPKPVEFAPVEVKGVKPRPFGDPRYLWLKENFPLQDERWILGMIDSWEASPSLDRMYKDAQSIREKDFKGFQETEPWALKELKKRYPLEHIPKAEELRYKWIQPEEEFLEEEEVKPKPVFTEDFEKRVMTKPSRGRAALKAGSPGSPLKVGDLQKFYQKHGKFPPWYQRGYREGVREYPAGRLLRRAVTGLPSKEEREYSKEELEKIAAREKEIQEKRKAFEARSKKEKGLAKTGFLKLDESNLANKLIEGKIDRNTYAKEALDIYRARRNQERKKTGIRYVSAPEQNRERMKELLMIYIAASDPDLPPFPLLSAKPEDNFDQIARMLQKSKEFPSPTPESMLKDFHKVAGEMSFDEYLDALLLQQEIASIYKTIKQPKFLAEIEQTRDRVTRLYKEGKISADNRKVLRDELQTKHRELERAFAVEAAGGKVKFLEKEDEKRAKRAALDLSLKQDTALADLYDLRNRVKSAGIQFYMGRKKTYEEAEAIVNDELNKSMPLPTMNDPYSWRKGYISEMYGSKEVFDIPGLYLEGDQLVYDTSRWRALKDALKQQPRPESAYQHLIDKHKTKYQELITKAPFEAFREYEEPEHPGMYYLPQRDPTSFEKQMQLMKGGAPREGELDRAFRVGFSFIEGAVAGALSSLALSVRGELPDDPLERAIKLRDMEKKGYKLESYLRKDANFWDQYIYNIKKWQTLGPAMNLVAGDAVGEGAMMTTGLIWSFGLPITGVPTALRLISFGTEVAGKTVKGMGKATRSKKTQRAGEFIEYWASPRAAALDRAKARQIKGRLRQGLEKKEADLLYKDAKDLAFDTPGMPVNEAIAKVGSDNASILAVAKGLAENGRLNDASIRILVGQNPELVMLWQRANMNADKFSELVNRRWAKWEKGAKASEDPLSAMVFNQADYVKRFIENIEKIKKTQTNRPWLSRADVLTEDILDNLFSIMLRDAALPADKLSRFWTKVADLKGADRNPQKYAELLMDTDKSIGKSFAPWDASPTQMKEALSESMSSTFINAVDNWLVADLIWHGGNVFSRTAASAQQKGAYKNAYNDVLGPNEYVVKGDPLETVKLKDLPVEERIRAASGKGEGKDVLSFELKNPDKIARILKEELGKRTSSVWGSDFYKDLLASSPSSLNVRQWEALKAIVRENLAKKHLGGKVYKNYGEAIKQAQKPFGPEIVRIGSEGIEGQKSFQMVPFRDIVIPASTFLKAMTSMFKKPALIKSPKGQGTVSFHNFIKEMDTMAKKTDAEFKQTVINYAREAKAAKAASPLVSALDRVGDESWEFVLDDLYEGYDKIVNSTFGGSYKRMVESGYVKTADNLRNLGGRIKEKVDLDLVGAEGKALLEKGIAPDVVEEMLYKKWTRDFMAYMNKVDAWEGILNNYYQIDIQNMVLHGKTIQTIMRKDYATARDRVAEAMARGETEVFQTNASNVLTPTMTNFVEVIARMDEAFPEWQKQKLKTPGAAAREMIRGKKGVLESRGDMIGALHSLNPWLAGSRKAVRAKKAWIEWADKNIDQIVTLGDNPAIARPDPKPLIEDYTKMGEQLWLQVRRSGEPFKDQVAWGQAKRDFINAFAKGMTKNHLDALEKVNTQQMVDLTAQYYMKSLREDSLYPDMGKLLGAMKGKLNDILEPMGAQNVKVLKDALKGWGGDVSLITKEFENLNQSLQFKMMGRSATKIPMDAVQYTMLDNVKRSFDNILRAQGVAVGDNIESVMKGNKFFLKQPGLTDKALTYGHDMEKTVKALQEIVNSKRLATHSEFFKNAEGGALVENLILSAADAARRIAVSGMLGGTILPGTRYLSTNIWTAPFIAANIGRTGLGAISPTMHAAALKINTALPDTVLFTSVDGKAWKAGELRYFLSKHNIGFSEESFHMARGLSEELMRETADMISATGPGALPAKLQGFMRKHLNFADFNAYSKFAFASDQHFRNTVAFQALRNGKPEKIAADLGRRSMLDYGAPGKATTSFMKRITLFWRFRLMMLAETMNMTGRAIKADQPSLAMNALRTNMQLQKDAETWVYSDDSVHSRMFLPFKERWIDNDNAVKLAGPMLPTAEAYETMTSAMKYAFNWKGMGGRERLLQFKDLVLTEQYTPAINMIVNAIDATVAGKKGAGKVPDDYIQIFKATGSWPWVKEYFQIVEIPESRRYYSSPVYGEEGVQYQFRPGTAKKFEFATWTFLALMAGQERAMREYSKAYMAGADPDADARFRSYEELNPLLYMLSEAKVPLMRPGAVGRKSLMKVLHDLKEMEKSYEKNIKLQQGIEQ